MRPYLYTSFNILSHQGSISLLQVVSTLVLKSSGTKVQLSVESACNLSVKCRQRQHFYFFLLKWMNSSFSTLCSTFRALVESVSIHHVQNSHWLLTSPQFTLVFYLNNTVCSNFIDNLYCDSLCLLTAQTQNTLYTSHNYRFQQSTLANAWLTNSRFISLFFLNSLHLCTSNLT